MKIAIVSSMVPHIDGGYRKFVDLLAPALESVGHAVEKIWLPFSNDPATMLAEMTAFRMADFDAAFEMVICTRPPAHVIQHRRKVVWLIHQERIFYDLWDSEYNKLAKSASDNAIRQALMKADNAALREAQAVFSNSQVVAERLSQFNGIAAEVVYPPLSPTFHVAHVVYGDELLFNCRITDHKRQHLAVQAMAHTHTAVRLRIVGRSQSQDYLSDLRSLVSELRLEDRVTIDDRWISEGEKRYLLAHSLASVYLAFDEDSYGYPTLEAARARRATVAAVDSGGVAEFINDGANGFLCEPKPKAIALAFDRLWSDRKLARSLGEAANKTVNKMDISWDQVVKALTA
jgi:glycosyltransferase involved in cell wall biosynthesis